MWAATEQSRLAYIRTHQMELHAELYQGVIDAFSAQDLNPAQAGQRVILPASFSGSTWDMQTNLQNALALSHQYGVSDLFITVTANPAWIEIQRELHPGETPASHPDLVSRVFNMKIEKLL